MRYYFDFQDEDGHGAVDDDGIEFSTFEEARSAAARALSEHALEVLPDGHATRLWVDVRNGDAASANWFYRSNWCASGRVSCPLCRLDQKLCLENRSAGSISLASSASPVIPF